MLITNWIRRSLAKLTGKHLKLKKQIAVNYVWYGNTYGGFYVHPDILNEDSVVYSFGIGEDISFDIKVMNQHDCNVHGFDPTPKSIEWVNTQAFPDKFSFHSYGIGEKTEMATFYLPKNKSYVSGSFLESKSVNTMEACLVPIKSFKDITLSLGHTTIDIIKMDIEGSEYKVLPDILTSGIMIKQILVEFHHRMLEDGLEETRKTIELLKKHGFELFAFSANSEELSFINKNFLNPS